jgi:PIN domain nuclease of toxin-antitoxin system
MKKYLLDTCAFLWAAAGDASLSSKAKRIMASDEAMLVLSSASIWEMAIKISHKRLVLPKALDDYMAEKAALPNLEILPVFWTSCCRVSRLPFHHHDPFDRLLIAQALDEKLPVVTSDAVFKKYGVTVIW